MCHVLPSPFGGTGSSAGSCGRWHHGGVRAFVAVVPPAEALSPLADALPDLRARWPDVGWIPPERWHLTLCFLGDIREEAAESLARDLTASAAETPPIHAVVGGGGSFPGGRRARVLWVGVDAEPLTTLAARVGQAARKIGVEVDSRPYRPHITIGRVRKEPMADPDAARATLSAARGARFEVDRLLLFRSFLGPKPRYEELVACPLGSASP